jgi:Zn-dependent protease
MPTRQGSFHLFQLFGIDVYLHWSWFFAMYYFIKLRESDYTSMTWNVMGCLSLFLIVLMHEFGHALACRQVGGQANQIVLWPLGGVAYVSPPQRPGAMLWSIAAGPLVNVVLFPILTAVLLLGRSAGWGNAMPNAYFFVLTLWYINTVLLIFNMLPIYPLDGGQIFRSLLWFVFGRARSLMIATIVGFIGVIGLIAFAFWEQSIWMGILCVFILLNCWGGLMQARALARVANAPRREGYVCPNCKTVPPQGAFWMCGKCRKPFDTFASQGVCPNCGVQYTATSCPECGTLRPFSEWMTSMDVPPQL